MNHQICKTLILTWVDCAKWHLGKICNGCNQWRKLASKETTCVVLFLQVCSYKKKLELIFCVSEILNGFVFLTLLRLANTDAHKISKKEQGE